MNQELYDDEFFLWHLTHVHDQSVEAGAQFVLDHKFKTIVDYGCGIGSYLEGAYEYGADIKGYEISEAARVYTNESIQKYIEYKDFLTISEPERADVCICIEVAEHINSYSSRRLINLLTKTSDYIVFSAAPPGQEGTGHINCQDHEFWYGLFEKKGFRLKTRRLESWESAPDYVLKNLMIFEK